VHRQPQPPQRPGQQRRGRDLNGAGRPTPDLAGDHDVAGVDVCGLGTSHPRDEDSFCLRRGGGGGGTPGAHAGAHHLHGPGSPPQRGLFDA
jgi:hypothetical protein